MRSFIFPLLALLFFCMINPNTGRAANEEETAFSFRFYGFVKTDYWYDSRTVVGAREDLFLLLPAPPELDAQGRDLNGDPLFNFTAITSRLGVRIEGPEAFGANTWGLIEADFSGVTNADINGFRQRHAFVQLDWEKASLLLGQWWHPMFTPQVLPRVVSLNTGAPFQPFIRNPQATLTYRHGSSQWLFSLLGQRDMASDGPGGLTGEYLRYTALPNLHGQWMWHMGSFTGGLAADYKLIRPRRVDEFGLHTAETLGTYAFMGYMKYTRARWEFLAKAIWGQNLSEHQMLGGYVEAPPTGPGGVAHYIPLDHLSVWGNILYGGRVRAGLFMGYVQNLGAAEALDGQFFGRGQDIAYAYRLAPSVVFTSGRVDFCTELEYTVAAYGQPDAFGKVKQAGETGNLRLLFTALYHF